MLLEVIQRLRRVVFRQREICLRKTVNGLPVLVGDGDVDDDKLGACMECNGWLGRLDRKSVV